MIPIAVVVSKSESIVGYTYVVIRLHEETASIYMQLVIGANMPCRLRGSAAPPSGTYIISMAADE